MVVMLIFLKLRVEEHNTGGLSAYEKDSKYASNDCHMY